MRRAALAVLACASILAMTRGARAQACCVAPGTVGPARLARQEVLLVGVEARARWAYGSLDGGGAFRTPPKGAYDVALEQDLFVTGRLLRRGQLTATLPFVETLRGTSASSSSGGGLGDVRAAARWDLLFPEEVRWVPGIAVLAGGSLPTGVPAERASDALATGATGTGTASGWVGLGVEQTTGPWLFGGLGQIAFRADRTVDGMHSSLPPRFLAGIYGAWATKHHVALSLSASYSAEGDASVDGREVPGTARRVLQLGTGLQIPLGDAGRIIVSATFHPPFEVVSAGEPTYLGLSLALVHPRT
jgi:hypothetical protein